MDKDGIVSQEGRCHARLHCEADLEGGVGRWRGLEARFGELESVSLWYH